jgi:hypothetical protein
LHEALALDRRRGGILVEARATEALGDRGDQREEIPAGRLAAVGAQSASM